MTEIHPTAIVAREAEIGEGVVVKPFSIIEPDVVIGPGCSIGPFAVIRSGTRIGAGTQVHTGAVLGEPPQDLKYKGEESYLIIGERNLIREFVTIHRATGEGNATLIGDDNMLMAYSHVGHNCRIGSGCMIANSAGISGHCVIEDGAVIGGMVGIHQYVTIGTLAMVGGMSRITRDVPPYCLVEGNPAKPKGINVRGLERHGFSSEAISGLKKAFRLIFRSEYNVSDAIRILESEGRVTDEVRYLIDFLRRVAEGVHGRQANP
ncbi:MAG: acyl-ACP--UDP-N-acetylglucosamine O-acyltransferase [Armatimonadetes bacterium]|nr:acyl-ACP--UDP-N-acetylglucosamine O-acyltransferase [Armatimonadota bacterium]